MNAILDGVMAEFSDLSAVQAVQLTTRLLIAGILGGLIGRDRERAGKAAGVRTHLLVAVGAAAFVAVPQQSGATPSDVARIIQGLVTGIGFLGAGCIWKDDTEGRVEGLTTAAGLWLTAAAGGGVGNGTGVVRPSHWAGWVVRDLHPRTVGSAVGDRSTSRRQYSTCG